ncbi:hypothetical protein BT93_E2150 [Corymbia citriodora subsp. variegata]|nr:hypothetical protein BT93_E2150 [Corymbia citriodora subsp. variegata]
MELKRPATTMSAQPPSIPLFLLRLPYVLLCLHILTFDLSDAQHCYDTGNFTAGGNYAKNRELILSSLPSDVASNGRVYSRNIGNGSDVVYVLSFCRGDSSNNTCFECISAAAKDLMIKCPNQKAACTWGTGDIPCIIRYSDVPMYGVKQTFPTIRLFNTGDIQMDQDQFDQIWRNFTEELAAMASMGTSELKFAARSTALPNFQTMFALLQCSPDLSRINCQSCLWECINDYQDCCHGKQGGVVQKPSCIFRWDLYPFFESDPSNPPPSPPPPTVVTEADPHAPPPSNAQITNGNIWKLLRIVIGVVCSAVLSVMVIVSMCCFIRRSRSNPWMVSSAKDEVETDESLQNEVETAKSLQFKLSELRAATNVFSEANKLGEGGFGRVYKGKLENGQYIAVKRLMGCSNQGQQQFKNEVALMVRLQHKNLIKLHGYCLEEGERILVLEFAPNASLEEFISDENMNPKITDFGTARLFVLDQSRANTAQIAGTFGYMAPEYVRHGEISMKTDVYSFGVVILEIISGKKNSYFSSSGNSEHLLSYAWKNWRKGTPFRLIDPMLNGTSRSEMLRCIHVALVCVQENVARRPNMASVVLMLESQSTTLPVPTRPAYLMDANCREMLTSSTHGSSPISINEASMTDPHPR